MTTALVFETVVGRASPRESSPWVPIVPEADSIRCRNLFSSGPRSKYTRAKKSGVPSRPSSVARASSVASLRAPCLVRATSASSLARGSWHCCPRGRPLLGLYLRSVLLTSVFKKRILGARRARVCVGTRSEPALAGLTTPAVIAT